MGFFEVLMDDLARRLRHQMEMESAHRTWELFYGFPCGPPDERRFGRPRGILTTIDEGS